MALTRIQGLSQRQALQLYKSIGSATTLLDDTSKLKTEMPGLSSTVINVIESGRKEALIRAEQEALFDEEHGIRIFVFNDEAYPFRLRECEDAPLVLYYKGKASLNGAHVIGMVGTRQCTEYGKDMCQRVVDGLAHSFRDTIIVSGLAYGVDIHSHRAAVNSGLGTVAVLAHGLDRIYPSTHRSTALQMLERGGLLTEYMTGTEPVKGNFVSRNRIVAGLCDGCIVIESRKRGGAMITAHIARDYNRDVMAVPGRASDEFSSGCNELIRSNIAALVSNSDDVLEALGWTSQIENDPKKAVPVEATIFPTFTAEEQVLVDLLKDNDGKQINQLTVQSQMPVQRVSAILFELEISGAVKQMPGGRFRLLV